MWLWDRAPDPFKALVSSFFARFFENEITTSLDDLKGSFFWLLAALAVPGMFLPWMMVFDWQLVVMMKGPGALREASQAEKAFYLGFAMIASGLLTTIVWSSLLPDYRDTLILGALPVAPRTIVAAKLTALAGYILLVAVAMHAIGAVFFGVILGTKSSAFFTLRGIVAHFVAASAASGGVALVVAAAQGLILAVGGPRVFRRVSIVLQVGLVAVMAVGVAVLPIIAFSMVHTLRGFGGRMQPWVLSTPPAWFLGLYEWILGTTDPALLGLARNAALLLGGAVLVTLTTYPFAYRRLMVSSVERTDGPGRYAVGRLTRAVLICAAGRHPEARAAADFYTATLSRVERHRFALAMAVGITMAWLVGAWKMMDPPTEPEAAWLSLPLSAMIFLLVGLRLAASLPGDVRGGWLFEVNEPSRRYARQALERTMLFLGVLPPTIAGALIYWWVWGPNVAVVHTAVAVALGTVILEALICYHEGMPCGQRWNLSGASLGYRWPLHVAAFFALTIGIPRLEVLFLTLPYFAAFFVALLTFVALAIRRVSTRHVVLPAYDDVDPVAGVLRLN